ncbi:MAG: ParB/RepB/Spo0J family partition protein [Bacilli bacterium]|nr:ParB/RepB/Spo0J family partition protein [Bacilli bacterium]
MNNMEKEIIEVSLDDIIPNRFQPRLSFDETALNELAKSIRQHGIIQPLVLRKIGDKFEIIAGERRYKAAYIAGLSKVPAVIIDLNDNESAEVAIVENIQRKNLSPIEEAKSYKKLLDRGYLTQDELASRMGKTQGSISNKLRLLNLSKDVQDALLNNQISERHARSLLKLTNEDEQIEVLNRIINERLNVRDTDLIINSFISDGDFVQVDSSSDESSYDETSASSGSSIDFNTFFNPTEDEKEENDTLKIEDKVYPEIEDKVYPAIETEEKLMIEEESSSSSREKLQLKVKEFIEDLKREGYVSTYDSYEFENLYEFIIKIEK